MPAIVAEEKALILEDRMNNAKCTLGCFRNVYSRLKLCQNCNALCYFPNLATIINSNKPFAIANNVSIVYRPIVGNRRLVGYFISDG